MNPRTMSVHWLLALFMAAMAIVVAAIAAYAGWRAAGAEGAVLWLIGGGMAGVAVVTGFWIVLDRILIQRQFDHRHLPARPEFYDFDLLNQPAHGDEFDGRPLKSLRYVVFDTETTGLRPSEGDEIISIAGVAVIDGAVQTDQSFSRLVDPRRTIPPGSTRFHGITDDMVAGEATAAEVLPAFRDFVGDAVLVAHNAAFDMKFLKLKEQAGGSVFGQVVLDTLLLSVFLETESRNHTLDAIAERMGVTVEGRHTAMGDALTTAHVFVHMLDILEARGIRSLSQALSAANKMTEVRRQQNKF
jgi:DNA polymerase III subunit epsilon